MNSFDESSMEYASFLFEGQKVVAYCLQNSAGGTATILNFPASELARQFQMTFLADRNFEVLHNQAQLLCITEYATVMRTSDHDPRVKYLTFSRDYLTGTLSHIAYR
jgi:hypothetical protein